MDEIYSDIRVRQVPAFRLVRYAVISAEPENDAMDHMVKWARSSGLLEAAGGELRLIGWNFPFVTEEQAQSFGLRGYVSACILPEGVESGCGAGAVEQEAGEYAVITVRDPFAAPFERISGAYRRVMAYLREQGLSLPSAEGRACVEFEEVRARDGVTYMDVYVPIKR